MEIAMQGRKPNAKDLTIYLRNLKNHPAYGSDRRYYTVKELLRMGNLRTAVRYKLLEMSDRSSVANNILSKVHKKRGTMYDFDFRFHAVFDEKNKLRYFNPRARRFERIGSDFKPLTEERMREEMKPENIKLRRAKKAEFEILE